MYPANHVPKRVLQDPWESQDYFLNPSLSDVATKRLESILKGLNLLLLEDLLQAACFTDSSLALVLEVEHLDLSGAHPGNDVLHLVLGVLKSLLQVNDTLAEYLHLCSLLEALLRKARRSGRARESRRNRAQEGRLAVSLETGRAQATNACVAANTLKLGVVLETDLQVGDTVRVGLAVVVTSNNRLSDPASRVIKFIGKSTLGLDAHALILAHRVILVSEAINLVFGSIAFRNRNRQGALQSLNSKLSLLIRPGLMLKVLDSLKRLDIGSLQLVTVFYLPLLLKSIFSSATKNVDLVCVFGSLDLKTLDTSPQFGNNLVAEVVSLAGGLVELSTDGVDEVLEVVLDNSLLRQSSPEVATGGLEVLKSATGILVVQLGQVNLRRLFS
ncbi:hypothetical protein HG530_004975 [Fusarium avenaceum]|nr:hypothetical protein HG530_004975 [Fusarium avenaceum]